MLGERLDSWLRGHESLVDVLTALVPAAVCVLFGLVTRSDTAYFLFTALLLVPVMLRRRQVVACLTLVTSVAFVQWLTLRDSTGLLLANVAVPLAVHAAAAYGPSWAGRAALAAGLSGAVLGGLSWPLLTGSVTMHLVIGTFLASTVVAAWAVGVLQKVRRAQAEALADRARLLEVERDQRARLAVMAERTRIAREMHDIVAHSLAVMIAQSDGGRYVAASSPEAGLAALATIGDCARQALGEIRRVLGILRDGPAAPQPGLADVPALVDRLRTSGLDVRLTLEPAPGTVDPGLSLAAYRVVQEGLTNVVKHAGPTARAEVSVRWSTAGLTIDVLDNGRSTPNSSGGYGIAGMRERTGAYGGTVTLRPRPGGGHVLSARIPVPA
ncbi:sensor histidine kinase [Actinocrispum wychmicini]|nr:sensor histidine kinase [Actinocrispum wychmicini]